VADLVDLGALVALALGVLVALGAADLVAAGAADLVVAGAIIVLSLAEAIRLTEDRERAAKVATEIALSIGLYHHKFELFCSMTTS
jgi:hypothetical protein